ncbi:MAG TPA: Ig-like domain-containing protein, partial [Anaerolineales bacterium]
MQNHKKNNHSCVKAAVRAILVLMLVLPGFLPEGMAQANGRPIPSRESTDFVNPSSTEDLEPQTLPFSQDWANTSLITISDDWSSVPGIMGYRGDNLTASTGTDPQTLLMVGTSTPVDVNANLTDPDGFFTGGVTEFELPDTVVALAGSGTADAPFILISVDTQGMENITISYNLRDLESGADNAIQQVALHYRIGNAGDFTNLPGGYVNDATVGSATMVTPVSVALPIDAENQPLVQLRVMTTNAVGNDEWIGVDDISIMSAPIVPEMLVDKTAPENVEPNDPFDYTLSVVNALGITANQVVITDSLPLSVTFQSASDGGILIDTNVVSWTVPTMLDATSLTRTVSVIAPITETILVNNDYGVWASNWLTFTLGAPVTTTVETQEVVTPIGTARAAGDGWSGTMQGNVTVVPGKIANNSFAIQDATGGIYVYPGSLTPMDLGDLVVVQGTIDNYNGLLELSPVTEVTVMEPGTPPDPQITQTGIVSDTQGLLIQIQGTVTSITGTGNKTIIINDGSGEVTVYIYTSRTGIITTGITPGVEMSVIGLSYNYNHVPQVIPRYQSDLYIFPPEVTGTYPADGASNVNLYRPLTATFSHSMDPGTIDTSSFTLTESAGGVSGVVSYDAGTKTASLTPTSILSENALYTATLTTNIKDIYNTALTSEYTWTFTSGITDVIPPSIAGQNPAPGEVDVPLS